MEAPCQACDLRTVFILKQSWYPWIPRYLFFLGTVMAPKPKLPCHSVICWTLWNIAASVYSLCHYLVIHALYLISLHLTHQFGPTLTYLSTLCLSNDTAGVIAYVSGVIAANSRTHGTENRISQMSLWSCETWKHTCGLQHGWMQMHLY